MSAIRDFFDFAGGMLLVLAFLMACMTPLFGLMYAMDTYACHQYGDMVERDTEYKLLTGCYVKYDKGWIKRKQIRMNEEDF